MGKKIGFIGLGLMGLPMATNLKKRLNCDLYVFNVNSEVMKAAVAEVVVAAASLQEIGQKSDTVVSMIPNNKVLRAVVSGPNTGLLPIFSGIHMGAVPQSPRTRPANWICSTLSTEGNMLALPYLPGRMGGFKEKPE